MCSTRLQKMDSWGIHSVSRGILYPRFTQACHFSSPRKTASSIASWMCNRGRKQKALSVQSFLKNRAPHLIGNPIYGPMADPKYIRDTEELENCPPRYSLFDKVVLVPPSYPGGGENGRRPKGIGRLEGSKLVAELLRYIVLYKGDRSLSGSFFQDLSRWIPRLNAKESAIVLHAVGVMWYPNTRIRSAVARRCIDNILGRWQEVRLCDVARALHAVVRVMSFRDFRLLAQTLRSFGHLLESYSTQGMAGLTISQRRKHLQTLLLLLGVFAHVNVPYPSLVAVASTAVSHELTTTLQPVIQPGLFRQGHALRMKDGCVVFSLPSVGERVAAQVGHSDVSKIGGKPVVDRGCALTPSEIVSVLEHLAALGVRSEPLMLAVEQHVAHSILSSSKQLKTTLPKMRAHGCKSRRSGSRAITFDPNESTSAVPVRDVSHRYSDSHSCVKVTKGSIPEGSYMLHPFMAGGASQSVAGSEAPSTFALRMNFSDGYSVSGWNISLLSQVISSFGILGRSSAILLAMWMNGIRHQAHHLTLMDLTRTIEAAASVGLLGRPLTRRLFRCLTTVIDNVSARVSFKDVFYSASVAARLPGVPPQFWLALQRRLKLLFGTPASSPKLQRDRCHVLDFSAKIFSGSSVGERGITVVEEVECHQEPEGSPVPHGLISDESGHASEYIRLSALRKQSQILREKDISLAVLGDYGVVRTLTPQGALDTSTAEMVLECIAFASPMVSLQILQGALPLLCRVHAVGGSVISTLRIAVLFRLMHLRNILANVAYADALSFVGAPCVSLKTVEASNDIWNRLEGIVRLLMKRQSDFSFQLSNLQKETAFRRTREHPKVHNGTSKFEKWLAITEGPLADLTIRDLSLYAIYHPSAALSVEYQGNDLSGLAHCQSHARMLLMLRQRFSALCFSSMEEIVALLHLELLPFCSSPGILAGGVVLLETFADRLRRRQEKQVNALKKTTEDSIVDLNDNGMREKMSARSSVSVDILNDIQTHNSAVASNPSVPKALCSRFPSHQSLVSVLEAFSSRIEAATPNVVLHAARLTLNALRHPCWLQRIADEFRRGEAFTPNNCSPPSESTDCIKESLGTQDGDFLHHSVYGGAECSNAHKKDFEIVQTACLICSLVLDAVQTRIVHYQANGLALLAAEIQRTLVALRDSVSPKPNKSLRVGRFRRWRIEGENADTCWSNSACTNDRFSCIIKLQKDLERCQLAIASRWRTTPTTVTTAGPASSLNVCIHVFGLPWKCICTKSVNRSTNKHAQMIHSDAFPNCARESSNASYIQGEPSDRCGENCDREMQRVWYAAEYEHITPSLSSLFAAQWSHSDICTNIGLCPINNCNPDACNPCQLKASLGYLCPCKVRHLLKAARFLRHPEHNKVGDTCVSSTAFDFLNCDNGLPVASCNRDVALLWLSRVLAHDRS